VSQSSKKGKKSDIPHSDDEEDHQDEQEDRVKGQKKGKSAEASKKGKKAEVSSEDDEEEERVKGQKSKSKIAKSIDEEPKKGENRLLRFLITNQDQKRINKSM
jgi:hypothetical protein